MKNKIIKIASTLCMTLGVMLFSNIKMGNNNVLNAQATSLVETPQIGWNNIDYSKEQEWVPNRSDIGVPQEGYCLLALYPSNIAASTYTNKNLLEDDVEGCNVGDHILINGTNSEELKDIVIYCYPQNGLFLYIPHTSVNFSEEYEYVTVEVLEGMSIDGAAQTVATRFEYRGLLGSYDKWEVNPAPLEKVNGEFTSINWNNRDFSHGMGETWSGELNVVGAPINGYCLLAFFNEEGKSYNESAIGDVMTIGRGVIGIGLNADYKIKINGVNIIDVDGAICYIYPKYGVFFYTPDATLPNKDKYLYPTISLEEGLHFNNVVLPKMSFEYRGNLGELNCWVAIKDSSLYNHLSYSGIAGGWNNIPLDAMHNQSILQFGEYEVDYLKNSQKSDGTNLVGRYSDCGTKITINGLPLWKCGDPVVSYAHGYCYVYLTLPIQALQPSNGYKVVTFHIEEGTIFHDTALGEVNLYLYNGEWVSNKPNTPEDSDYVNALSLSQTFGAEQITLNSDNQTLSSTKECSINSFGLMLDYKLSSDDSSFVFYFMGKNKQDGLRIVILGNSISLYDATQENVLLGNKEIKTFVVDEYYSLFFLTKVQDDKLSISISIDEITYIKVDNVALSSKNNLGNLFNIYLGSGSVSLKDTILGSDNKKPILSYDGKAVYGVIPGSPVIDFANKVSAIDLLDGNVSKFIKINWPEGALTNNTINEGNWDVVISVSDSSKNEAKVVVKVIATDNLEVTVTFDNENPTVYRIGDHIASIAEPVKEGKRFIGWYYNDKLWDFENDYVICDINLVSKYIDTVKEYCVSFTVEGLNNVTSFTMYFEYGATFDISVLAKEGYSLTAYVDDVEVETISIVKDMDVKLVYTSTATKKGCGGSMASSVGLLSIFSGAAFILLVFLKKKGGKEHE